MTPRTLYITPDLREDYPTVVREGLARRRLVVLEGRCPCGARLVVPSRAERRRQTRTGRVVVVTVEHEDGCPAIDPAVDAALAHGGGVA